MRKLILTLALTLSFIAPSWANHPSGTVKVDVNGLVCDFCARALEKVFGKQEAVDSININLDEKQIAIHFKEGQSLDDETIKQLITDSGYNVVEIHHDE